MTQNRKDQPTRHPVTHTLIVLDDVFLGVSVGATSDVDRTPTGLRHRFGQTYRPKEETVLWVLM